MILIYRALTSEAIKNILLLAAQKYNLTLKTFKIERGSKMEGDNDWAYLQSFNADFIGAASGHDIHLVCHGNIHEIDTATFLATNIPCKKTDYYLEYRPTGTKQYEKIIEAGRGAGWWGALLLATDFKEIIHGQIENVLYKIAHPPIILASVNDALSDFGSIDFTLMDDNDNDPIF